MNNQGGADFSLFYNWYERQIKPVKLLVKVYLQMGTEKHRRRWAVVIATLIVLAGVLAALVFSEYQPLATLGGIVLGVVVTVIAILALMFFHRQ